MTEVREQATEIHDQFSEQLEVTIDEVEERLDTLVNDYKVPVDEARRSVVNSYLDRADIDRTELAPDGTQLVRVGDLTAGDQWVDLKVRVVDLWEPGHESIAQVGLLGDESGTIRFVAFETSDLTALDEEQSYRLENVVTDEYQDRISVKLNRTTTITEIDEEIEVGDDAVEVVGALVDVQSGSGLIKRCPTDECTRVLQNGRCSEHGEVDGTFDLRIKGVLDDGETVQEVIFDKEATEALTGLGLEEAKEMAMDALDTTVVADEMRSDILGRYYRVQGPRFGRYVLANETTELDGAVDPEPVLIKARSI